MMTYHELLQPTKTEKHGSLIWSPGSTDYTNRSGTLTISGTRSFATYDVEECPADHGRGFRLAKNAGGTDDSESSYFVFAGSDGVGHCDCKGFCRLGRCKHLQCIAILIRDEQI